MASNSSQDLNTRLTRQKVAIQKRKVEEATKQNEESKRQKEIFASSTVIGPRDIIINSNIKLEDISESSLSLKQETLENESSAADEQHHHNIVNPNIQKIKLEEFNIIVKVEEIEGEESPIPGQFNDNYDPIEHDQLTFTETDLEGEETSSTMIKAVVIKPCSAIESEDDESPQNPINSINVFVDQKSEEVNTLEKLVRVLEHRLIYAITATPGKVSSDKQSEKDECNADVTFDTISNSILKDANIQLLYSQTLNLQVKLFAQLAGQNFIKMLIALYPELQLEGTLCSRATHNNWQTAINTFAVEMGHVPTWSGHPLKKLIWPNRFSSISQLSFDKPTTVSSTVLLDNISIESDIDVDIMKRFFTMFGNNILYIKIHHDIKMTNLNVNWLNNYVKLCLVPNLVGFTIVCTAKKNRRGRRLSGNTVLNETFENWQSCTLPKLEKLESLVFEFENLENMESLSLFATKLICSYSKQLKQLSISCNGICRLIGLNLPNLTKLTISQSIFRDIELECINLETISLINYGVNFYPNDIGIIEALSHKLTCLEIKFECTDQEFHDYVGETSLKLPNVSTLVLDKCDALTFRVLHCFPNLRYLKLVSEPIDKSVCSYPDDAVLHIKKLFQHTNLYKSQRFWENFPNILVVTLEFSGQLKETFTPKLCTFTREGYIQYCSNNL